MAEQYSFFNSINGDRKYKTEDWANYFSKFITNGIFPNVASNLQVFAETNDMRTKVRAGAAWINGYMYQNTSDLILTHEVADGVLDRIDRIIVRLDYQQRLMKAYIKKGVFSGTPVAPALQRDSDAYEIALADVYIGKGVIGLSQSTVTDLRLNSNLCGMVNSILQADTTAIFNQYQVWFNQKSVNYESEFQTWFDSVKGQLSGDVAGNLANRISANDQADAEHKADYVKHAGEGTTAGSNNAYTVSLNPAPPSYTQRMGVIITIHADSTSAATLNVNGLGAKKLLKPNGNTVTNLKANGVYHFRYNPAADSGAGAFMLVGEGGSGNLKPNQALAGLTFTNDDGEQVGTGDPNLSSANIVQGKQIFGVNGTAKIGDYKIGEAVPVSKLGAVSYPYTSTAQLLTGLTSGTPNRFSAQAFTLPHIYISYATGTDYKVECWNYETQTLLWTLTFDSVTYSQRQFIVDKITGKLTHVFDIPKTGSNYIIRKINPDTGVVSWTYSTTTYGDYISENEELFMSESGALQKLNASGGVVWNVPNGGSYAWARGAYLFASGADMSADPKIVKMRKLNKSNGVLYSNVTLYTISQSDYDSGYRAYLNITSSGSIVAGGSKSGTSLDYRGNLWFPANNGNLYTSISWSGYYNGSYMQGSDYSQMYSDDGHIIFHIGLTGGSSAQTYNTLVVIDTLNDRYSTYSFTNNQLIIGGVTILGDFNTYRSYVKMYGLYGNAHFIIRNTSSGQCHFVQGNTVNASVNIGANILGFQRKGITFTPKTTSPVAITFNIYPQEPGRTITG